MKEKVNFLRKEVVSESAKLDTCAEIYSHWPIYYVPSVSILVSLRLCLCLLLVLLRGCRWGGLQC